MHCDVDHAGLNVDLPNLANEAGDASRQLDTSRGNSGEHNFLKLRISLNDFVRNPSKRATNCLRVHDWDRGWWVLFYLVHAFPWRPHRIALKEKN